jgi:hypothetical protein
VTDIGQGVIIFSSTLIPDSFDDPIGGILRIYIYIYIYLKHNYFYFNNELICLLFLFVCNILSDRIWLLFQRYVDFEFYTRLEPINLQCI